MVKVINIDTKTRTIRVENADSDIKTWRTTESGTHFPIKKGESTKEALDKFVDEKREQDKRAKSHEFKKKSGTGLKFSIVPKGQTGLTDKEVSEIHKQQPAKPSKKESDWPESPKFEKLTEQYMPKQGEADNELGEVLRSINQIVYRYYNDGDMWNKGYGKETVNGAIKHLTALSKNKETPRHIARGLDNALFELKKYGVKDKDRYETALKIMMQTMEWADEKDIESLSKMKRNTEKQQSAKESEDKLHRGTISEEEYEPWEKEKREKKEPTRAGDIVKIKYSDGSFGVGKVNCFTTHDNEIGCEVEDDQGRLRFYPKKQLEALKYVPKSEITDGWTNDSYYKGIKGEHMRAELYKDPAVKEAAHKRVERSQKVEAETGVSPEDWEAYESVRQSGATNMYDYAYINATTGLPRETIRKIQENYEKLQEAYGQE